MKIPFFKYQGTGNDFVLIDNRIENISKTDINLIEHLCDRKFGIGADGLILLQNKKGYDFEMIYFNADGKESSMCGNGGRCITAFAKLLGIIEKNCSFLAIDGDHEALIDEQNWVQLKMQDVQIGERGEDYFVLDTGSPHYVVFVEDIDDINVIENGKAIRYSSAYKEQGINVNFVEKDTEGLIVATYERGVEDETLSCGTGVTACAIAYYFENPVDDRTVVPVKTKGGKLEVRFDKGSEGEVTNVWLCGPARLVFEGTIDLKT